MGPAASSLQVGTHYKRSVSKSPPARRLGSELPTAATSARLARPCPSKGEGTAWQPQLRCTKGSPYCEAPPAFRGPRSSGRRGITFRPGQGGRGRGRAQVRRGGGRKPDSCRGGGGTAAAGSWELKPVMLLLRREASLPIPQAGGHHPGRAHRRPGAPAASPRRPLLGRVPARARAPAACEKRADTPHRRAPLIPPHPHSGSISQADPDSLPRPKFPARLRQSPSRRPGARRSPNSRRLLFCQSRLSVCGAGAHAQTPSSLRPRRPLPPPPPSLAGRRPSSSCARALVPPLPMPRETGGYGGAGEER